MNTHVAGGRYDFEDGGTYCGGWEDGKAHGHGVCTGPKGQGEYCGQWAYGFEASGIYTWPSGNCYQGQWMQGKRHGLGIEKKDKWIFKGEWTQGFKGRYGVRLSISSGAKYEGTWTTGLQDGYGCETYADGGTYQGQWLRGMRHGYGVRQSVPYGLAAHYRAQTLRSSLTSLRSEDEDERVVKSRDKRIDETRGGFVLTSKSEDETSSHSLLDKPRSLKRSLLGTLKLKKQRSTGDISDGAQRQHRLTSSMRSTRSYASQNSSLSMESGISSVSKTSNMSDDRSFYSQDDITDVNVTECYMGEWKGDKRSGYGVSERSDGLRYEGEWYNNKKYGYGQTTFRDESTEAGKYKNNILVSSGRRGKLMMLQKNKLKDRIATAVSAAQRAAQLALQKADIGVSRMANARAKAEQAIHLAEQAQQDSDTARIAAKEIDPKFLQPGTHVIRRQREEICADPSLGSLRNIHYNPQIRSNTVVDRTTRHNLTTDSTSSTPIMNHDNDKFLRGGIPYQPKIIHSSTTNQLHAHKMAKGGHDDIAIGPSKVTQPPPPKPKRMDIVKLEHLLNPAVLSDHFDHYGISPTIDIPSDSSADMPETNYNLDGTDMISQVDAVQSNALRPLESTKRSRHPNQESSHKSSSRDRDHLSRDDSDLCVMENDIRKQLLSESRPSLTQDDTAISSRKKVQHKQNVTSAMNKQVGSMPDVTVIKDMASMSRGELMRLGAERREEIKRLLEEQERREVGDIGVLANDMKKWVQQRQLMMFVVAVNATLASVVINMMGG